MSAEPALRLDNFRYLTGLGRKPFSALLDVCVGMETKGKHVRDHFFSIEYDARRQAWKALVGNSHSYFQPGGLEVIMPSDGGLDLRLSLRMGYLHPQHSSLKGTYSVYAHKLFFEGAKNREDGFIYVGLTKHGWRQRLTGHLQAARSGSNTLFHKALRAKPMIISSTVLLVAADEDEAMAFEEDQVSKFSLYIDNRNGLNMIPGGRAGLRFLHDRAVGRAVTIEDREVALDNLLKSRRISLPNPAVATHWNDPEYAARVMCGRPGRFSVDDLGNIADLHAVGYSADAVAGSFGVSSRRVLDFVSGKTYNRVRK